MRVVLILLFVLVFGGGAPPLVWAQNSSQLNFELGFRGHVYAYHYKWLDHNRKPQQMTFELGSQMVKQAAHEFQPFDNAAANEFVLTAVKTYAENLKTKGISMLVQENPETGKMVVSAKGAVPTTTLHQEMNTVTDLVGKARDAYIQNRLFRKFDAGSIMPDHARIAELNYARMRPVASAIAGKTVGYDFRERVNFTLGFLQSIPYDELLDRENSNGSGFATPVELLSRNLGDCDSKSVAFASIIRNIYPQIPMVMVLVPGHAFVGIAAQQGPDDFALRINGRTYVLAEPVGPALLPLGKLDKRSEAMLRGGQYTSVVFK